ncbi:FCS-Like Zinc finger 17-like [Quercus suber]|uniref:FCS-Like Zinc finger 17-like n=1 Tax=Quercus suber TaxID=58331 RepID=UPI0032DE97A0
MELEFYGTRVLWNSAIGLLERFKTANPHKNLLKFKSPFKMEDEVNKQSKQHSKSSYAGHAISNNHTTLAVGSQILTQISHGESNILVKSALKLTQPTSQFPLIHLHTKSLESSFLKMCYLCDKKLSLHKDVYMGDQGFCSIKCRNRQIVLEEMRELETSTKNMVASYRHCYNSDRRETQILLEEIHQRHKPRPIRYQINWAIVS